MRHWYAFQSFMGGLNACSPAHITPQISLAGMSLAAVPMDTVAEERNGKRPCGNRKTKTGEKRVHEKPRHGNRLMKTTYQWSDPLWAVCLLQFSWEKDEG